ncbi:serine/threonine-protein kinase Nek8-like [Bacillus rossius redtenbacheri]|uniref:serine/threonine-protein kinase Nek8-like n=1 Tax=Bacillus rossius redtenbacheri TaxID=93214 RepID=UPI002FDE3CB9
MERYVQIRVVGRGSFGAVHLCTRQADCKPVIVKSIPVEQISAKDLVAARNEVRVLSMLTHPCIVRYLDSFHEDSVFSIVMEFASGGTLQEFIARRDGRLLPQKSVLHLFCQAVLAVQHVHSHRILHRDLKTANIFLTGGPACVVKVGDFGISKVLSSRSSASTVVGTPCYMSPELCQGQHYNAKSDIWALGCVLYEMLTLRKAFQAPTLAALVMKIMQGSYMPVDGGQYDSCLLQLLSSMLSYNPAHRPAADQIMAHVAVVPTLYSLYVDLGAIITTVGD